jgi:plasmid segregation protein ParM
VRVVELIQKRWAKYPDAQAFYVLGGGAGALKPYIEERTHGKLPLRFVSDSEWMNAAGYLKMLKNQGLSGDDMTKQSNPTSW